MTTGRRGPAPQPAAVKKAKGNPGKRTGAKALDDQARLEAGAGLPTGAGSAVPSSEGAGGDIATAEVAAASIPAPHWLNGDGLEVWNRLAPKLATMKILQHLDADAFGRYCQNFGRWVKLQKRLDTEGETYESESPHGKYIRSNPAFMIADRLDRALERAEANFALNPADRQRLFAARAAAAGAGGADLFGHPVGGGGKADDRPAAGDRNTDQPKRAVGFLN